MGEDSEFIRDLRARWREKFTSSAPFQFRTIAGDQDEFVPSDSSLTPFPLAQQAVVAGNHLSIVKPAGADNLGVRIVVRGIMGDAAPAGPRNSARVAVESRELLQAIRELEPHKDELDAQGTVALSLALEETGRQQEAIALLQGSTNAKHREDTDPLGVLAEPVEAPMAGGKATERRRKNARALSEGGMMPRSERAIRPRLFITASTSHLWNWHTVPTIRPRRVLRRRCLRNACVRSRTSGEPRQKRTAI